MDAQPPEGEAIWKCRAGLPAESAVRNIAGFQSGNIEMLADERPLPVRGSRELEGRKPVMNRDNRGRACRPHGKRPGIDLSRCGNDDSERDAARNAKEPR